MKSAKRICLVILACQILASNGSAEWVKTEGVFRGYYEVNQAGVGRFHYFIVAKSLTKQLERYRNHYVEIEILDGHQVANPGPAFATKIGKVRIIDQPLRIKSPRIVPVGENAWDTICVVKNISKSPLRFYTPSAQLHAITYQRPAKRQRDLATGYWRDQLEFKDKAWMPTDIRSVRKYFSKPGEILFRYHHQLVRLEPNDEIPIVLRTIGRDPGNYLLTVGASLESHQETVKQTFAIKIPPQSSQLAAKPLAADVVPKWKDDWLEIEGRLLAPKGEDRYVFARRLDSGELDLPELLVLRNAEGKSLKNEFQPNYPDSLWTRHKITKEGLAFRRRVRTKGLNSDGVPRSAELWLLTSAGWETISLCDELPRRSVPNTSGWGKAVNGCRCRIQMAKREFRKGERLRFWVQLESNGESADIFWIDRGNLYSNVQILVDGKLAMIRTTGLPDGCVIELPITFEMGAKTQPLDPGEHNVTISLKGDSGTFTDLNKKKYRKFDGTINSPELSFIIR